MAEPVSSVVTLASVSLEIICKTRKFIQETMVVDTTIQKLLENLQSLEHLIGLVDSTTKAAQPTEDDTHMREALARCRSRLQTLDTPVKTLASRKHKTIFQKVILNIRLGHSRPEIEGVIKEIRELIDDTHIAISFQT